MQPLDLLILARPAPLGGSTPTGEPLHSKAVVQVVGEDRSAGVGHHPDRIADVEVVVLGVPADDSQPLQVLRRGGPGHAGEIALLLDEVTRTAAHTTGILGPQVVCVVLPPPPLPIIAVAVLVGGLDGAAATVLFNADQVLLLLSVRLEL